MANKKISKASIEKELGKIKPLKLVAKKGAEKKKEQIEEETKEDEHSNEQLGSQFSANDFDRLPARFRPPVLENSGERQITETRNLERQIPAETTSKVSEEQAAYHVANYESGLYQKNYAKNIGREATLDRGIDISGIRLAEAPRGASLHHMPAERAIDIGGWQRQDMMTGRGVERGSDRGGSGEDYVLKEKAKDKKQKLPFES